MRVSHGSATDNSPSSDLWCTSSFRFCSAITCVARGSTVTACLQAVCLIELRRCSDARSCVVQILPLIQSAVACRLELAPALPGNTDLLYLDLSLEDVVRGAIERGVGSLGMGAAAFVGPLLQNLVRFCLFLPALQSQKCVTCAPHALLLDGPVFK